MRLHNHLPQLQHPARSPRSCEGASSTRFRRFCPNCDYVRRNCCRQRTVSPPTQQNAAANFISKVTLQTAEPLLQGPPQWARTVRRRKKQPSAPLRKSVRIAVASWLRGDAQAKARQVLMKKLGFMEDEGRSSDDMLLGYFKLFGGPLSGTVIQALTALCGLGDDTSAGCSQA